MSSDPKPEEVETAKPEEVEAPVLAEENENLTEVKVDDNVVQDKVTDEKVADNKVVEDDATDVKEIDMGEADEYKKYSAYFVKVDPNQEDRATEIKLCSFARPHMRSFHWNWFGFFMAFFIWFSIAALLTEIKTTLKLTKDQIWTSNVVSVAGTVLVRVILGPLCDKYGPRWPYMITLICASIPVACTGLVQNATGLTVLRFFIGIAGGCIVMCQQWSSRMFAKEVVGTANGMVGGWGNLGGGVTLMVTGSVLFPMWKAILGGNASLAWRLTCIIPAIVAAAVGVGLFVYADDCPKGNYTELKKHGNLPEISAAKSFRSGAINFNTWILFLQYAGCFGVELTLDNAAALYFHDQFGLTTETAALVASLFGWMNIFSRGLGGFVSDLCFAKLGMRGRILIQTLLLAAEGVLVIIFANQLSLGNAIAAMVFFSLFCQMGCGSTYALVPYVDPPATGAISGIVSAGGNIGAVCYQLIFRQLGYKDSFLIMAYCILGTAATGFFLNIKGYSALLWGKDVQVDKNTGTIMVPEHTAEAKEDVNA